MEAPLLGTGPLDSGVGVEEGNDLALNDGFVDAVVALGDDGDRGQR